MDKLIINKYGELRLGDERFLLVGAAAPLCTVGNDAKKNTEEMVKRWNAYGELVEQLSYLVSQLDSGDCEVDNFESRKLLKELKR